MGAELDSLPLPFPFSLLSLGEVPVEMFGKAADGGGRARFDGRKTVAQWSYSRQSKYDLASKYLDLSLASSTASLRLGLVVEIGGIDGIGSSASCIGESGSISKSGFGMGEMEFDNSASLEDWNQALDVVIARTEFHTISQIDRGIFRNTVGQHHEDEVVDPRHFGH